MLSPALERSTGDDFALDAAKLAATLKMSLGELAEMVGVSRNTLAAKVLGPKARDALEPVVRILSIASEIGGGEDRAAFWFRYNPIVYLEGRTAKDHVERGEAEMVLLHLRNLVNGGYA